MNHFYNRENNYFISANSKVMSSTLKKAPNLEHANLKELLYQNIKKRIGLNRKQKFYLIVRHPSKRLASYYRNFFSNRVERLGLTHFELEDSHVEILNNLGYKAEKKDISYKSKLEYITYHDIVKILPLISNKDAHLIPQTYLLKWRFGRFRSKLKMDRVLKMENKEDMRFIADKLNIDISKKHNHSPKIIDTSLPQNYEQIIKKVYREDFDTYDYN
jgi:Leucine-rich repeat (LRR) protein